MPEEFAVSVTQTARLVSVKLKPDTAISTGVAFTSVEGALSPAELTAVTT